MCRQYVITNPSKHSREETRLCRPVATLRACSITKFEITMGHFCQGCSANILRYLQRNVPSFDDALALEETTFETKSLIHSSSPVQTVPLSKSPKASTSHSTVGSPKPMWTALKHLKRWQRESCVGLPSKMMNMDPWVFSCNCIAASSKPRSVSA